MVSGFCFYERRVVLAGREEREEGVQIHPPNLEPRLMRIHQLKRNHHSPVPRAFLPDLSSFQVLLSPSLSLPLPYFIIFANSCHLEQFWEQWKSDAWEVKGNHQLAWNQSMGRVLEGPSPADSQLCRGVWLLSSRPGNLGPLMVSGFRWDQNNSLYTVLFPVSKELEGII